MLFFLKYIYILKLKFELYVHLTHHQFYQITHFTGRVYLNRRYSHGATFVALVEQDD